MDAAWIKEQADFIMLGAGFAGGIAWAIWKMSKMMYEKKNGPSESAAATRHDINSLHTVLSDHAEATQAGFRAVDKRLNKMEDTQDETNKTLTSIQSDVRSVGERTDRLESRMAGTEEKTERNSRNIARVEGSFASHVRHDA